MSKKLSTFTIAVCLLCTTGQVEAQSLWQHRSRDYSNLIQDTQARCAGDVITVLINETTGVENRDQRQLDREAGHTGGLDFTYGFGGQLGTKEASANGDLEATSGKTFDGQSQYTVDREFSDRITATVVECLPNGNLVIYGRRERMVSGERRALVVSGVVRPLDILADNTVESRFIANFRVSYDGRGVESKFTGHGWLTECWNKIRNF